MFSQRQRPFFLALAALVVIWAATLAGYQLAQNAKVTPEKVRAYVESVDFSHLSAAERAAAMQKLAHMLNALTLDERQRLRLDHTVYQWFNQMTDAEKGTFLAATMPAGFKQMIAAFEDLPADQRQRMVEQAMRQMKADRDRIAATGQWPAAGTNTVALTRELQDQVTKIGLQTFYSQSSAQTKAELAPFLEELQRTMESGRMLHGQRP